MKHYGWGIVTNDGFPVRASYINKDEAKIEVSSMNKSDVIVDDYKPYRVVELLFEDNKAIDAAMKEPQ